MWIMVAGPWGTGARDEAERAANLSALNVAALEVLRRGHLPVVGTNLALPIVEAAGGGDRDGLVMRLSLAAADRCDAVVRIGGASRGADREVERIRARGGRVYASVDEVPDGTAPVAVEPYAPRFRDACERLIASLPEWFGLPEANAGFLRGLGEQPSWIAVRAEHTGDAADVLGAVTLAPCLPGAFEVTFLAVQRAHHRRGVGRALLGRAEDEARARGGRWVHAKTLGPSHPDPGYAATRAFWVANGYAPLLETTALWGADNPALLLVKRL